MEICSRFTSLKNRTFNNWSW